MTKRTEILSGEFFESAMMAVHNGGNDLKLLAQYLNFLVGGTQDVPGPLWPAHVLHGKRRTFTSFHRFLLDRPGNGLGLPSLYFLKQVLEATPKDGERAIVLVRAELAKEGVDFDKAAREARDLAVPELPKQAKGGRGNKTSANSASLSSRNMDRASTLARLKRDYPMLAKQVIAGEMSANAAAIEAGFRKKLTPLEQALKWWAKMSKKERTMFLSEIAKKRAVR